MRAISALLRSAHPVPAAGVTLIAVLLGIAVGLEPVGVLVLFLVFAFNQISVGLSNDWIDAERDRVAERRDKPLVRGEISVGAVRAAAFVTAALALGLSFTLGVPFAIAHVLSLGAGWAYNLGLKRGVLSPLPYLVAFGVLPALATLALPTPAWPAWWAVLAGALLGVAAHVANVLPDLAADAATGVRGLPHRLGAVGATVLAGITLVGAAIALAVGLGIDSPVAIVGLALSLAASAAAVVLGLRGDRLAFRLVILAALLDAVLLVLAGARMIAG